MWCFAFSHTSTFELIPAVATAQPVALVTDREEEKQYNKKVTKLLYFPYLGGSPLGRFDPKVA